MKKTHWWIVGSVAVLAAILFFGCAMTLVPGARTGVPGWGYGGYGMMGRGMMGNWGYSPFSWVGMGLAMLFMWILPIGILALIVFGVVSLARNTGNLPQSAPENSCPNCGKGIQADWRNCPYCGTVLK